MKQQQPLAVIVEDDCDVLEWIRLSGIRFIRFRPGELDESIMDLCRALVIIGGTNAKPLLFHPRERLIVEKQFARGKKVFSEYCESIGNVYSAPPKTTRFERIVYCGGASIEGLAEGDLLDEQCNTRIAPYRFGCTTKRPLFQYVQAAAHGKLEVSGDVLATNEDRALWFDEPDHLLICAFRLANFARSRFAPLGKWRRLVQFILEWVGGQSVDPSVLKDAYRTRFRETAVAALDTEVRNGIQRAISWFDRAHMLLSGGKDGVREGVATEIEPDGTQRIASQIRNDCTGETALAFAMNYMLTGDETQLAISDRLLDGAFYWFLVKEEGRLSGMMRWTQSAWGTNYQDDAARVIIPQLLKNLYLDRRDYTEECSLALDFLLRTTGTDGTRVFRTDNADLTEERMLELASVPGRLPSGHYNGFYFAALLLAYKLTGDARYKAAGVKGMEAIMSAYPDTVREQSQTQELCRLMLPLSWLYWATGEERHKEWLYRIASDLQRFRHPSGAYLEWDEGYAAAMHGTKPGDESSILTRNGDPVVDMLYSVNWLPVGFMQAYFVTRDDYFKRLWEDVASFLVSCQIHSDNPQIDGAWTRAFDVELGEVFGYPGDGGWGPWAIESGWTVAEIVSGLAMGLLDRQLVGKYK